ncbi:hypothetical protein CSQ85_00155 [Bifidobacterium rousetti]|uniref:phage distal tail protein n=1 Tax=Bifidobacterium rousetti TaxID=2045439 RepID=UPI00123A7971|nr:hypothetical protein [Bifidobacterium rousetti]KAA8820264.1 hypothetical protein CSQ85_00155 [Bifidobacterium rousetti]
MDWDTYGRTRVTHPEPPDGSGLTINGEPLHKLGLWLADNPELAAATPTAQYTSIPGTYGSVDTSLYDLSGHILTGRRDLTIHLVTAGDEPEATETMRKVAAWHGTTVSVWWRLWPGTLHGVCSVGAWTEHRDLNARFQGLTADLTISCEPLMDGTPLAFTIDVDGATARIEGNRPTGPLVRTTPPAATKRLYLTFGDRQLVFNHDFNGAEQLVVDCTGRKPVSRIGDAVLLPSVDSDYPVLVPGFMSCTISAGEMTVTYTPKWMI